MEQGNYNKLKCSCWHTAHCGTSCTEEDCDCRECDCPNCRKTPESENQYLLFPEDDGYDTPKNPYSQV